MERSMHEQELLMAAYIVLLLTAYYLASRR